MTQTPHAAVLHIDPTFGHVAVDLPPEAMRQLGCRANQCFAVRAGTQTLHVRYATYPFLLGAGTWFAYDHPEGWLTISIASAHMFAASASTDAPGASTTPRARADAELRVSVGDELVFEALEGQSSGRAPTPRIRGERAAALEAALQARPAARDDGAAAGAA